MSKGKQLRNCHILFTELSTFSIEFIASPLKLFHLDDIRARSAYSMGKIMDQHRHSDPQRLYQDNELAVNFIKG